MRYCGAMPSSTPVDHAPTSAYVVAAHPHWGRSRVTARLLQACQGLERVQVCDLYRRYPDYAIDVSHEQAQLERAQLLVLLHPLHWYAMPALLKLWIDEVFTLGWAYGGAQALGGKDLWLVTSTGGAESSYHPQGYNRYFFDAFLPPYEQTAALCGMRFLPPMVLHGAHRVSDAALEEHAQVLTQRLQTYPQWDELQELDACPGCAVPQQDRPNPG